MALDMRLRNSAGTNFAEPLASGAIPVNLRMPSGGGGYTYAGITGTIAAALTANSSVFAMRLSPTAGSVKAYIRKLRLQYTTIVAYTTAVTAGRRLALFRGAGAAASGGTGVGSSLVAPKDTNYSASQFDIASGGDIRISTTGALTVTGITYETEPMEVMTLVHVGAAGAYVEHTFEWNILGGSPLVLNAGQLLAVRNPAAMDAAGTWQLGVDCEWYEGTTEVGS